MNYDKTKTLVQNIGTTYEYFVLDKMKNNYDKVWHWRDFPEEKLYELGIIKNYNIYSKYRYDLGVDLVAVKNNIYYFIQCKNYSEKTTLMTHDLGGFYFFIYEYNLKGILYYNGKISQRVTELSTGRVDIINQPFNSQNVIINKNNQYKKQKLEKRQYQIDAYNKLKDQLVTLLHMPCGTGKLYVSSLLGKFYNNIVILSPLRFLASQCLDRLHNYLDKKYEPILISSDGYRNTNNIKEMIKDKNIISVTYDSVDILLKIIKDLENVYVIIDEFHNLSQSNLTNKNDNIYKLLKMNHKKLYMSVATSNIKVDIS